MREIKAICCARTKPPSEHPQQKLRCLAKSAKRLGLSCSSEYLFRHFLRDLIQKPGKSIVVIVKWAVKIFIIPCQNTTV